LTESKQSPNISWLDAFDDVILVSKPLEVGDLVCFFIGKEGRTQCKICWWRKRAN